MFIIMRKPENNWDCFVNHIYKNKIKWNYQIKILSIEIG